MDEWLLMEGHRCRGAWFLTHFTIPPNGFKAGWPDAQNRATKEAPFLLRGDFDQDLSL